MNNNRTDLITKEEFRNEDFLVRIVQNTSVRNPLRAWTIRIFSIITTQDGQEILIPGITADLYRPSFGRVELKREKIGSLMPLLAAAEHKVVTYAQELQDQENAAREAAPRGRGNFEERSFDDSRRSGGDRGRGNRGSRRHRTDKWNSVED